MPRVTSPLNHHPVNALWDTHHPASGYPAGVIPVAEPLPGLGFFPGGFGLWGTKKGARLPPFPVHGVMVLGHDFHSEAGYLRSQQLGGEPVTMPTWRNLLPLLDDAAIDRAHCFFTNFYMGLRAGSCATGPFPGASDPEFVVHCRRFLLRQIAQQQPALILTLGLWVPALLARISPNLEGWTAVRTIRDLDAAGPVQRTVKFPGVARYSTVVAALVHPCFRQATVRHRCFEGAVGAAAELAMLQRALELSRHHGTLAGKPGIKQI